MAVLLLTAIFGVTLPALSVAAESRPRTPIRHLIVLIQQNHSFDSYFGTYPGADGIPPGTCMPVDPADPENADCVAPFPIGDGPVTDLDHSAETFWRQFNGGRMNGFVEALNRKNQDGSQAMGYYDDRTLPYYWNLADEYVLFDRFFAAAHAGSVPNMFFAVAAMPVADEPGTAFFEVSDLPTIFDRLQERGISWKYYIKNYQPELTIRSAREARRLPPQVQWMPLLRIPRFLDNPVLSSRIVDLKEYFEDLDRGTLPAVSFILALGATEHPLASVRLGQRATKTLIQALKQSDAWRHSAFILTYDDWGGAFDHVPPPQVDDHGYGFRVPALLVSPYARRGHVDSTVLDSTSILKFIEENWELEPLATRDAQANSIACGLDFSQPPRKPNFTPFTRDVEPPKLEPRRSVIFLTYGSAFLFAFGRILRALGGSDARSSSREATDSGRPV